MKTLLTLFVTLGFILHCAQAQTQVPPPWTDIQLTGYVAKVPISRPPQGKGVPLWIPITGGLVTGGGLYWLLRDEDTGPEPIFVLRDDRTTVPCGIPGVFFNPLFNDVGGRAILSVEPADGATIAITADDELLITADGSVTTIQTTLRVMLEDGRIEESRLTIEVTRPALEAVDDTAQTPFEQPWTSNVLENDTATDGELSDVASSQHGQVEFTADGTITYTPAPGFSGTDSFTYTVTARCGQTTTGTVRIEVLPKEEVCDLAAEQRTQPAHCGNANGRAELSITPEDDYQVTWPDGVAGASRDDLTAGSYTVTVTRTGSDCSAVFEVVIEDVGPDFSVTTETGAATCGASDGSATAMGTGSGAYSYTWSDGSTGPSVTGLAAGVHTVEVTDAATGCSVSVSVTIETLPIQLELLEEATPSGPTAADGAVSLAVTGPGAPPYQLVHNGVVLLTFDGEVVTATGLGWGAHEFQVRSVEGCLSNVVSVTFAQVGSGWTVGTTLGGPGGNRPRSGGTVEHPTPETLPRPAWVSPGLRLTHYGRNGRTVAQLWPGATGRWAASFSPQWRVSLGRITAYTGPGIWWQSGPETADQRVDWRWTAGLDIGLPQFRFGRVGVEASLGPFGGQLGVMLDW